jgi:hypothetical protein
MRRLAIALPAFVWLFAACAHRAAPPAAPLAVGFEVPAAIAAPVTRPNASPRIVRVWLSQDTVSIGDVLYGHVTTSTNVASLEVRLGPSSATLRRTGYGQFDGRYRVPWVPAFLRRSYPILLIARNAAGHQTEAEVSVAYR